MFLFGSPSVGMLFVTPISTQTKVAHNVGRDKVELILLDDFQMEAPMSDWFRSIPHALDAVAYAAKVLAAILIICLTRPIVSARDHGIPDQIL
ncbi:hypothetical protein MIND_01020700 [Mycena indigotica]|uniref:Uncharacterized protein n=1 Tax=Mycena indigotica TaxID=2126181 RepID=A0A8H6VYF0_9AGAR|nr:uncharacterized protein MIND_01020700 [Mycena indigotica]KAF7294828.1 hypothetical protein MIND_01020700 [Mycena indigotica]